MKSVLIIEDDINIVELIEIHLKDAHFTTSKSLKGNEGLQMALKNNYDLIILDLMLPEINGIEICKILRSEKVYSPILMLTAKSEEIDKIIGLETGADDYLTKPFSIREFIARVKAIVRRNEIGQKLSTLSRSIITCDGLLIDVQKRKVLLLDKKVDLTPKEFELLYLFMSNPGKSFSREKLLSLAWGYEFSGYEHTVNSHINRLRAKIEIDQTNPKYILTTWGVGYRFNDEIEIN